MFEFDLKFISENHGWEYALLGICIVFSGLVILSFIISQLHKLLGLWDNRKTLIQTFKSRWKKETSPADAEIIRADHSISLTEAKLQYKMLVDHIGEPFALPKLLRLAEGSGLHRPHSTINELLQSGAILPDETGYYLWKT